MNWLFLTILAITSRSAHSITSKLLSNDVPVSPITQSILMTTSAGLLSLIISPFIGGISFKGVERYVFPAILMVCTQAFGNIIFYKGQKKLDAGTTQIAFSSILIWGTLLSVFYLKSLFSLKQSIGIITLLIAIIFVQYKKKKIDLNSNFLYIVFSAFLFAIFQVTSADLSKTLSTGAYLILVYLGSSVIIGGLYFNTLKTELKIVKNKLKISLKRTILVGCTSLLYFIFSYNAYRMAPDQGVVVVLLTSQVILSVIFGIVLLKEKENLARKILAGVLAFIAGILIKS